MKLVHVQLGVQTNNPATSKGESPNMSASADKISNLCRIVSAKGEDVVAVGKKPLLRN